MTTYPHVEPSLVRTDVERLIDWLEVAPSLVESGADPAYCRGYAAALTRVKQVLIYYWHAATERADAINRAVDEVADLQLDHPDDIPEDEIYTPESPEPEPERAPGPNHREGYPSSGWWADKGKGYRDSSNRGTWRWQRTAWEYTPDTADDITKRFDFLPSIRQPYTPVDDLDTLTDVAKRLQDIHHMLEDIGDEQ